MAIDFGHAPKKVETIVYYYKGWFGIYECEIISKEENGHYTIIMDKFYHMYLIKIKKNGKLKHVKSFRVIEGKIQRYE